MSELRSGYLAIEGQMYWHDDARIVGDVVGLEVLRDAIDKALEHGQFVNDGCEVFQTDGEGYHLCVACLPDDEMQQIGTTYHDAEIFSQDTELWRLFDEKTVTLHDLRGRERKQD